MRTAFLGARVHDGERERPGGVVLVADGVVEAIGVEADIPSDAHRVALAGGTLVPGFVDLQVNGGDGLMLGDAEDVDDVLRIAAAHRRLGATAILPTLVTDTPERTARTIDLVRRAVEREPGVIGLHLEGPHLAPARRGAHPPDLVRPMTDRDEAMLIDAAERLPTLLVTLAPEVVGPDRVARLAAAGVVVFLGHSDASYATAMAAFDAGARGATHLFNAMSPFGSREPGLVGAALDCGAAHAGLIADGVHVHPRSMATALRAKRGPGRIHLVSDAMAAAGTGASGFEWGGRRVARSGGRLTLPDGTLAGADLSMARAVRTLIEGADVPRERAIAMATGAPAAAIGRTDRGRLAPGARADLVHLAADGRLRAAWYGGEPVPLAAPNGT